MTQNQFIERVLARSRDELGSVDLSKHQVEIVTKSVFEEMAESMTKEGAFRRNGFGTFQVRDRAARPGRNPQTGEAIDIPASKTIGFKPAEALKNAVVGAAARLTKKR